MGDGNLYESMLSPGAIDADCESAACHPPGSLSPQHEVYDPPELHFDTIHCTACHAQSVTGCYNCHFDSVVEADIYRYKQEIAGYSLLINRARDGKLVVRLKGGDPFVFGRGGEEALALRAAGIPFEVVPGVTAGVAALAYAGIPVTHRGLAGAVAFVTGRTEDERELDLEDEGGLAGPVESDLGHLERPQSRRRHEYLGSGMSSRDCAGRCPAAQLAERERRPPIWSNRCPICINPSTRGEG